MSDTYACPGVSAAETARDFRSSHRRSAVFWGFLLIVLGSAGLAAQFVPAVSWWMLWPLVVIVSGIAHMVTPDWQGVWTVRRLLEGASIVLLGAVLLGNTTGIVSWSVWVTFLSLWPVLVIALGISVIGRGLGSEFVRAVSRFVVWATLALAVYTSLTGAALGFVRPVTVVTVPRVGANGQSVNITIEPGAGVPSIRTW